jgi:uncharacterized membrane protein
MQKRIFVLAMSSGLVLRMALAPVSGHPFDISVYFDTGQSILAGRNFYGVTYYAYPPAWAGFLWAATLLYQQLAGPLGAHPMPASLARAILGADVGAPFIADWLFHSIVKTPLIFFDLFLALLIRRVVAETFKRPDRADMAAVLFFLNPHVVWISGIWGTFDVLPTYFAIAGTILFLERRPVLSGLSFGFAVALKDFPILLLFALLLGYRNRLSRPFVSRLILSTVGVLAVVSAPYVFLDWTAYAKGVLSPTGGVFVGNLSIWLLAGLGGLGSIPTWLAGLNIASIAIVIGVVSWVAGARRDAGEGPTHWIDLCLVALLTFYALFRIINDQYIFWSIPFLTVNAALGRIRWQRVLAFSGVVALAGVVNVAHYSFFLPILTISPNLAWLIPHFPYEPGLRVVLALVSWFWVVLLLRQTIRSVTGEGEVTKFLKSLWERLTLRRWRGVV